jgi:hypothetical protein
MYYYIKEYRNPPPIVIILPDTLFQYFANKVAFPVTLCTDHERKERYIFNKQHRTLFLYLPPFP